MQACHGFVSFLRASVTAAPHSLLVFFGGALALLCDAVVRKLCKSIAILRRTRSVLPDVVVWRASPA